jgi:hypothetical protein
MKRLHLLIVLVSFLFISISCNSAGTDTTTKTDSTVTDNTLKTDSTVINDTLKPDSPAFSEPH